MDQINISRYAKVLCYSVCAGLASLLATMKFFQVASQHFLVWDSAAFLINGAYFVGYPQYAQGYDPTRPPLIPDLLAVLFRMSGGPNALVGYILSAALYSLSMIGCFLVAQEIMNMWLALLSSATFGIVPAVYQWSGIVMTNVEAVAIGSIGFGLFVVALRRRRKFFFLVAIPLLFLAALTRYTLGIVLVATIVFVLISRNKFNYRSVLVNKYFGLGLLATLIIVPIVSYKWLAFPVGHHASLSILFPLPNSSQPGAHLGQGLYVNSLPFELGAGTYGIVLASLFVLGMVFALVQLLRRRYNKVDSVVYALIAWFLLLFIYYSLYWPSGQLRYSTEFAMPAVIIAFWFLSLVVSKVYSFTRPKAKYAALGITVILLTSLAISSFAYQAGVATVADTRQLDAQFNQGMEEASAWLGANVSPENNIMCNWFTFCWWYAPEYRAYHTYNIQAVGNFTYSAWLQSVSKYQVRYVVFVNPPTRVFPDLVRVWSLHINDTAFKNITIFRVV